MVSRIPTTAFLAACAFALTPLAQAEAKGRRVEVEAELVPTATGPLDAVGEVELRARRGRIDFKVEIEDLPLGFYTLLVNGAAEGTIEVFDFGEGAEGEIEFRNRSSNDKEFLDFNPSGAVVEILNALGDSVLMGLVPDVNLLQVNPKVYARQKVNAVWGFTPDATARPDFRKANGGLRLIVKKRLIDLRTFAKRVPAGSYELRAEGTTVASAQHRGRGALKFFLSSSPRGIFSTLDFDPTNTMYELVLLGEGGGPELVVAEATLGGEQIKAMPPIGVSKIDLSPTGVQVRIGGTAEQRSNNNRDEFRVKIRRVAPGVYDVLVDGVSQGMIVPSDGDGDGDYEGELKLRNPQGNDPGVGLLNFDPRGKMIQVLTGGEVVLAGRMPD